MFHDVTLVPWHATVHGFGNHYTSPLQKFKVDTMNTSMAGEGVKTGTEEAGVQLYVPHDPGTPTLYSDCRLKGKWKHIRIPILKKQTVL